MAATGDGVRRLTGLSTVDTATGEPAKAIAQRSDVCAVPAAGVVAEAMVALALADAVLEKFDGDSVTETARNVAAYLAALTRSRRSIAVSTNAASREESASMTSTAS